MKLETARAGCRPMETTYCPCGGQESSCSLWHHQRALKLRGSHGRVPHLLRDALDSHAHGLREVRGRCRHGMLLVQDAALLSNLFACGRCSLEAKKQRVTAFLRIGHGPGTVET